MVTSLSGCDHEDVPRGDGAGNEDEELGRDGGSRGRALSAEGGELPADGALKLDAAKKVTMRSRVVLALGKAPDRAVHAVRLNALSCTNQLW